MDKVKNRGLKHPGHVDHRCRSRADSSPDRSGRRRDVLDEKPDHLFVMIGINHVWCHFGSVAHEKFSVPLGEFARTYEELIANSRDNEIESIWLCGCFFVEPDLPEPMRVMCDEYNAAIGSLAKRLARTLIDMQAVFDRLLRYQHPMTIASDRVHPSPHGHMAMSEEILRRTLWD